MLSSVIHLVANSVDCRWRFIFVQGKLDGVYLLRAYPEYGWASISHNAPRLLSRYRDSQSFRPGSWVHVRPLRMRQFPFCRLEVDFLRRDTRRLATYMFFWNRYIMRVAILPNLPWMDLINVLALRREWLILAVEFSERSALKKKWVVLLEW